MITLKCDSCGHEQAVEVNSNDWIDRPADVIYRERFYRDMSCRLLCGTCYTPYLIHCGKFFNDRPPAGQTKEQPTLDLPEGEDNGQ